MLHIPLTNCHRLAGIQEPYQAAYHWTKNIEEFSGGKMSSIGQQAEKRERSMWRSRGTREETEKWNQMTALIFQTAGRHYKSPPPFGEIHCKAFKHTRRKEEELCSADSEPSSSAFSRDFYKKKHTQTTQG